MDHFKQKTAQSRLLNFARSKKLANKDFSLEEREILAGTMPGQFNTQVLTRNTPPTSVAFATVANDKFVPGLEALIASIIEVYPDFASRIYVFHDGSITQFSQIRLRELYAGTEFRVPDMSWFAHVPGESENHRRIGMLGFMNIMATTLVDYERVIILDSDMLILEDISAFWLRDPTNSRSETLDDDSIIACHDVGARPFVARSPGTGQFIINSGIISLPKRYLGEKALQELKALTDITSGDFCDLLDRFADQRSGTDLSRIRKQKYCL